MPLSKKAATEMITRFAEAVRAHEMRGAQPPEERDEIVHNYREARSDLACQFHATLDELERLKKENDRLDNELQGKALTDDGVLADAYWNCADQITPWLGEKTGPDTLINSVGGSLEFLIGQWREKKDTERRLAEANDLLDKVYQYVDSKRLGKLGQSRVDVLIADHKRLTAETCRHNWQMSLDGGTYICTECGGWK